MDSHSLNLDRAETEILRRAHDTATTKRRIWISVIAPLALATLVLIAFWDGRQPRLLLWIFVVYVLATMLERVDTGWRCCCTRALFVSWWTTSNDKGPSKRHRPDRRSATRDALHIGSFSATWRAGWKTSAAGKIMKMSTQPVRFRNLLQSARGVSSERIVGARPGDLQRVARLWGRALPTSYSKFLEEMGRSSGGLFEGEGVLIDEIEATWRNVRALFAVHRLNSDSLLSRYFPFLSREFHEVYFMDLSKESDDPPVLRFHEVDSSFERITQTFTEFVVRYISQFKCEHPLRQ